MIELKINENRPQRPLDLPIFHQWRLPDGSPWLIFYREVEGYLLRFPSLADYRLSGACELIECFPVPGVDQNTLTHLFQNQVLPLAQSRQKNLVFHGSAIAIGGYGVAFVGESGRGKSTLAASFVAAGASLVTDDGLLLNEDAGIYAMVPGYASIRLWEDSEAAIFGGSLSRTVGPHYTEKISLLAGDKIALCEKNTPLHRIYLLGVERSEHPTFTRLAASDALISLMKNSFLLDRKDRALLSLQLRGLSGLLSKIDVYCLNHSGRMEDLENLRASVLTHIQEP